MSKASGRVGKFHDSCHLEEGETIMSHEVSVGELVRGVGVHVFWDGHFVVSDVLGLKSQGTCCNGRKIGFMCIFT